MKNKNWTSIVGAAAAMTLAVVAVPSTAAATLFRALSPSACAMEGNDAGDYIFDDSNNTLGYQNDSNGVGARTRILHCPVISDNDFDSSNTTAATVYVFDGNTNSGADVSVKVCYESTDGATANCSTATSTSTTTRGAYSLTVTSPAGVSGTGLYALDHFTAGYFHELQVTLPPQDSFFDSTLIGYVLNY